MSIRVNWECDVRFKARPWHIRILSSTCVRYSYVPVVYRYRGFGYRRAIVVGGSGVVVAVVEEARGSVQARQALAYGLESIEKELASATSRWLLRIEIGRLFAWNCKVVGKGVK